MVVAGRRRFGASFKIARVTPTGIEALRMQSEHKIQQCGMRTQRTPSAAPKSGRRDLSQLKQRGWATQTIVRRRPSKHRVRMAIRSLPV